MIAGITIIPDRAGPSDFGMSWIVCSCGHEDLWAYFRDACKACGARWLSTKQLRVMRAFNQLDAESGAGLADECCVQHRVLYDMISPKYWVRLD